MNLFKEVADIKTADQLDLPTPEAIFETVAVKPTDLQQELVEELSKRAAEVHTGKVDPSVDNMLCITSDGRKLGLDQRAIDPMLPDEDGTKVNVCVNNIFEIWEDTRADKLTQLVFCDIATPKGKARPKAPADELPEPSSSPNYTFNVYDDIRDKLMARGVPREQVAFIHEANSEVQKSAMFAKVRSGEIRVLIGSTAKCGAGTNIQDKLVALHDLDCPWRPGDLTQRAGRIIRQGNQNKEVKIFRYVTESTFDAYLWQTVENKQRFISQIMSSKSPVRACDDVDEAALSYAEIKALCAGNPLIREKMDLDIDVSRLKLLKSSYLSNRYRLEDALLKSLPQEIEDVKGRIFGCEQDIPTRLDTPLEQGKIHPLVVHGKTYSERENAGEAILIACKDYQKSDTPQPLGTYRGFEMLLTYSPWDTAFQIILKGALSYKTTLGQDAKGNVTSLDNTLGAIESYLEGYKTRLCDLQEQMEQAKIELEKPFAQEAELTEKIQRLANLDALLNMEKSSEKGQEAPEMELSKPHEKPSVLEALKRPGIPGVPRENYGRNERER